MDSGRPAGGVDVSIVLNRRVNLAVRPIGRQILQSERFECFEVMKIAAGFQLARVVVSVGDRSDEVVVLEDVQVREHACEIHVAVDGFQAANGAVADLFRVKRKDNGPDSGLVGSAEFAIAFLSWKARDANLGQFLRLLRVGDVQNEDPVVCVIEISVREREFHTPRIRPAVVIPPGKLDAG